MDIKIHRFYKFDTESNTKAFVDLIVEGELVLRDFRLVQGKERLFLASPSKKNKNGKYFDNIVFRNLETKKKLEQEVIERYKKED